jgi:hypothetical protein
MKHLLAAPAALVTSLVPRLLLLLLLMLWVA